MIFALGMTWVLGGCDPIPVECANNVLARAIAPNGRVEAVLFNRSCGATTGFTRQISILSPGKKPIGAGTVFIADSDHGRIPIDLSMTMKWLSSDQLRVGYDSGARVSIRSTRVGDINVTYEPTATHAQVQQPPYLR